MYTGLWTRRRQYQESELNLIPLIDVMSVLVSFLLIYSADVDPVQNSKGVEIPHSTAEAKPKQSVIVMITKNEVFVQGEVVASIADVRGDVEPLVEPLRRVLSRPMLAGSAESQSEREITVIADKSTPFEVVKKVMATCTATAYSKISLAVIEKDRPALAATST